MARRRRWLLIAVATLAALAVWYYLARDPHADAWERYRKVRTGMSEDEVVELLGVPPGKYNRGPVALCGTGQQDELDAVDGCPFKCVWLFDVGLFEVGLDEGRRVCKKAASANMGGPPSVWARLVRPLGL